MQCVEQLSKIESASYVVPCNGVREHAYVVSLEKKQFWKRSWMKETAEEADGKADAEEWCAASKCAGFSEAVRRSYVPALVLYLAVGRATSLTYSALCGATPGKHRCKPLTDHVGECQLADSELCTDPPNWSGGAWI